MIKNLFVALSILVLSGGVAFADNDTNLRGIDVADAGTVFVSAACPHDDYPADEIDSDNSLM